MPNSLRQTSASVCTPRLISAGEGCAKHNRRRLREYEESVDHSGPGLIATPAFVALCESFIASTPSGSLIHRKMPPLEASNSAEVPNDSLSAAVKVSSFTLSPRV